MSAQIKPTKFIINSQNYIASNNKEESNDVKEVKKKGLNNIRRSGNYLFSYSYILDE